MKPNSFLRRIWGNILRPVLAWIAACWIAGLVLFLTYLVADEGLGNGYANQGLGPFDPLLAATLLSIFIALATGLPVVILVLLARTFKWRRGMAEVLAGAFIPFLFFTFFFGSQYNALADFWRGALTAATFIPAGAVGGYVYWLLAGRRVNRQPL